MWEGGGASYWRPGHGRSIVAWNVNIVVPENAPTDAEFLLTSGMEGPGKTLVEIHGNRRMSITYRPQPYIRMLNQNPTPASLNNAQLAARLALPMC